MRNIQASGNLYGKHVTVKQISKARALKLFSEGKEIYLQSSNMYPFGMWQSLCPIKYDESDYKSSIEMREFEVKNELPLCDLKDQKWQFDYAILNYSWYNCDSERGKYVNFYAIV